MPNDSIPDTLCQTPLKRGGIIMITYKEWKHGSEENNKEAGAQSSNYANDTKDSAKESIT